MRREKKVEYIKRISYSWRNLIYNSRYDARPYSELVEIMKYMYPTVSVSFINYVYRRFINHDPLYPLWDKEINIMYCYETEHKKYGVYYRLYDYYAIVDYEELLNTYSSRLLAEKVAHLLCEIYGDAYIVKQL